MRHSPKHSRAGLSYLIRLPEHEHVHTAGVNSICVHGPHIFTAGRDATLRRWPRQSSPLECELALHMLHTDWVTDLAAIGSGILVTSSCDRSLCATDTSNGQLVHRCRPHHDYVVALASAPSRTHFASAGLGGEIYLWNSEAFAQGSRSLVSRRLLWGFHKSAYSLTMNDVSVAAGSIDGSVKLWDTREPPPIETAASVEAHKDSIRALQCSNDGKFLATASSDATMKVCDLRMNGVVNTFYPHSTSVRALCCADDMHWLYSGDKDGKIVATDTRNDTSWLLAREDESVQSMVLDNVHDALLSASGSSSMKKWPLNQLDEHTHGQIRSEATESCNPVVITTSEAASCDSFGHDEARVNPICVQPRDTFPSGPVLLRHKCLPDKLRVLVEDSRGRRLVINVVTCQIERIWEDCGELTFAEHWERLSSFESVPSWFSADIRLGCLRVHLEVSTCLHAEAYATSLPVDVTSFKHGDEMRVNLGELVVRSLLTPFVRKQLEHDSNAVGSHYNEMPAENAEPTTLPKVVSPEKQPLMHVNESGGGHAVDIEALIVGSSEEERALPEWAVAIGMGRWQRPHEMPKAFLELRPAENTSLLALPELSRLAAAPIVLMEKMRKHVGYWLRRTGQTIPSTSAIELQCRGTRLVDRMTLQYVRDWVWRRRDEDVQVEYSLVG